MLQTTNIKGLPGSFLALNAQPLVCPGPERDKVIRKHG